MPTLRLQSLLTTTLLVTIQAAHLFAGEPDSLSVNVRLLVRKIQHKHVKPRPVDEAFGNLVHTYFYSFVDPDKELFRKEDLVYLKGLSAAIYQDIEKGKQQYFSEFERILSERCKEVQAIQKAYLSKPVQLNNSKKFDPSVRKELSQANYKTFWENNFCLDVFAGIVSQHPDHSRILLKDSLVQFEKKARSRVEGRYANYFENIRSSRLLQELYLNAIAMSFDPHSSYFSPEQKDGFVEELSTQKEKFGISYGVDELNRVVLTDILPGSSAWLSNELVSGDQILKVRFDWKSANWLDVKSGVSGLKELSEAFKNFQGREITLLVKDKDGNEIQVDLEKTVVYSDNDNIKNALMTGTKNIGYISLPDFYTSYSASYEEQGCANDMAKCILKLKKDGIEGLILDLRGNGGGSLYEAVALSGIFIDYGPILAIQDNKGVIQTLKDINRGLIYDGPLLVLIDAESASASEIVAAVLQDYKKAIIVGVPSFGKATSQIVYPLDPLITDVSRLQENPDYGYANITEGFLYRVTGKSNQLTGVTPDIELGMTSFDNKEERERTYENALVPAAMEKKITFTPSPVELPIAPLKAFSVRQRSAGIYATYYRMMDSIGNRFNDPDLIPLDLTAYWNESVSKAQVMEQFKSLRDRTDWTYRVTSNSFDQTVYDRNPILKNYFDDFTSRLKTDIELSEAVGIMHEWLQLISK